MRVASFNLQNGRGPDGVVSIDRLADAVRELDADVLALQEVDRGQPRSAGADLTAVAARAMSARSYRFVAALTGTPGEQWTAANGGEAAGSASYGIALLSRFPAVDWRTVRLPRIPVRVPLYLPDARRLIALREEPRVALLATLATPLGTLTVANTHLSFLPLWNRRQLRAVVRRLRPTAGAHLLLGDLNCPPRTVARVLPQWRPLAAALTFPADGPVRQLDHVLTDDLHLVSGPARTPTMPVSDHRPLVVDVLERE